MISDDDRIIISRATQTMQIIVGALATGVIMFAIVAVILATGADGQPPETPMLSYMSLVILPVAILVAVLFPGVVVRSQRETIIAGKSEADAEAVEPLVSGYQTAVIIRSAILEGAAFFCLGTREK